MKTPTALFAFTLKESEILLEENNFNNLLDNLTELKSRHASGQKEEKQRNVDSVYYLTIVF